MAGGSLEMMDEKYINGLRYKATPRLVFEEQSGQRILVQYWRCMSADQPGVWLPVPLAGSAEDLSA